MTFRVCAERNRQSDEAYVQGWLLGNWNRRDAHQICTLFQQTSLLIVDMIFQFGLIVFKSVNNVELMIKILMREFCALSYSQLQWASTLFLITLFLVALRHQVLTVLCLS